MSSDVQAFTFDNPYNGGANILVPSSLKWCARRVFKKLKKNILDNQSVQDSRVDFEKAEGLLNSFLTRETKNDETGQRPAFAYCPNLTARPFWQKEDGVLIEHISKALSENYADIKAEYMKGVRANIVANEVGTGKKLLAENTWKFIQLGALGNFNAQAIENFPKTVSVLSEFKDNMFSAEFIVMEPDTVLPPHTDATNAYLVCHMGLDVAENCGIQVHREVREFHEKDIIFFDQSYVHSAWNKGSRARVNLLVTFFHPEISREERDLIEVFIKKIKIQCLIFSPIILLEYAFLKLLSKFKAS